MAPPLLKVWRMKKTAFARLLTILVTGLVLTANVAFAATPTASSSVSAATPDEPDVNSCKKIPAGKRVLKLNLKPDSEIADVISWFSAISCTQFILPGQAVLQGRKVTILSPQLLTSEEAYRMLLGALETVGLKVEPAGPFLRVGLAGARDRAAR
jgi:hypothetical protein